MGLLLLFARKSNVCQIYRLVAAIFDEKRGFSDIRASCCYFLVKARFGRDIGFLLQFFRKRKVFQIGGLVAAIF